MESGSRRGQLGRLFHCGVYLDWLNIKMNGGRQLQFGSLFDYIRQQGGFIRTANFYAPESEGAGQQSLYDAVRKSGFRIIVIPAKTRGTTVSVDCDVMLAVDMVSQGSHLDVVFLLSHDADFIPAVRYLQSLGVRVVLLHADGPSNELRDAVDEWHHIGQIGLLAGRTGHGRLDWQEPTLPPSAASTAPGPTPAADASA